MWFTSPVRLDTQPVRGRRLPAKTYLVGWGFGQCPGLDIWVQHSNGTHAIEWKRDQLTHVWRLRPLQAIALPGGLARGLRFYVPAERDAALDEHFGQGWRAPS